MTEKFPGFFTAIFGGRKAKEPEPKRKPKRKKGPTRLEAVRKMVRESSKNSKQTNPSDETKGDADE
tara:strand:- start:233 stop:430 length:198 start_codon:yes stop_codon:yes gene_type:complete